MGNLIRGCGHPGCRVCNPRWRACWGNVADIMRRAMSATERWREREAERLRRLYPEKSPLQRADRGDSGEEGCRMKRGSKIAESSLARWRIAHFAPVTLSSGAVTEVCRNCDEDYDAHEAHGSSLPCPSKLNDRVLEIETMAWDAIHVFCKCRWIKELLAAAAL